MGEIKITQLRSANRRGENQQRILQALGLRRIRQSVTHKNTPQIRGMVKKVLHLVAVEETK